MLAVTDAETRILWTYGGRVMRRSAETVNFVAGGRWDDESVGTNALDLANRLAEPSMVFSAEHYAPFVHNWVCWAAPVFDPTTGHKLGVIDLSTTWDRTHPIGLATARVMARLIESALPRSTYHPSALLDETGDPGLVMTLLGTAEVRLDGQRLLLNRRQTEILALLALHPEGLSLEQLHAQLYGDQSITFSTLKAEVSHLRSALGGQLGSRPYRLLMPIATDVDHVLGLLRAGQVAAGGRGVRRRPAARLQLTGPHARWPTTSRWRSARRCSPTRSPTRCCATATWRRTTPRWSSAAWPSWAPGTHPAKPLLKGRLAASGR